MFGSDQEVFELGRQVRSELVLLGRDDLADRLGEVVDSAWSSATDALGELVHDFEVIAKVAGDELPQPMKERLAVAIREIREAIDRANAGGGVEP